MQQAAPTSTDIAELVAFLPKLEAEGFLPVKAWQGGDKDRKGVTTFFWPEYDEVVESLFSVASRPCWNDTEYLSHDPEAKLQQPGLIEKTTLAELKTLLTSCVRGERFCTGHWGAMIEAGYVQRILRRLAILRSEDG
jgi:hypothetical protein